MSASSPIKVSVYMAISLDGFIARPDGDVAWLDSFEPLPEGEDAGFAAFFDSVDVLVMGRGSFEKVLTFTPWPYGTKPVVVMSRSLPEVPEALQDTVTIETASPPDLLDKLATRGYQHVYLDGGQLVQSFLQHGLVDEMTLTTMPILIGKGIPLFGELAQDIRLRRLNTQAWDNGMVQTHYEVLR